MEELLFGIYNLQSRGGRYKERDQSKRLNASEDEAEMEIKSKIEIFTSHYFTNGNDIDQI